MMEHDLKLFCNRTYLHYTSVQAIYIKHQYQGHDALPHSILLLLMPLSQQQKLPGTGIWCLV